jgi:hypothetical protein
MVNVLNWFYILAKSILLEVLHGDLKLQYKPTYTAKDLALSMNVLPQMLKILNKKAHWLF